VPGRLLLELAAVTLVVGKPLFFLVVGKQIQSECLAHLLELAAVRLVVGEQINEFLQQSQTAVFALSSVVI
jgi:hypothetical protein